MGEKPILRTVPTSHTMKQMKPIREWLEQLPEGYRERAIENAKDQGLLDEYASSLKSALRSFLWRETPEGLDFWDAVDDHIFEDSNPLPPLPNPPLPAESLEREALEALRLIEYAMTQLDAEPGLILSPNSPIRISIQDILTRAKQQNKIP